MRRYPAGAAALLILLLAGAAAVPAASPAVARTAPAALRAPSSGAVCDLVRQGSTATAVCHNPDPVVTVLRLHVTCRRWWDPATDTAPVAVGPAQWATLTGRCWKEIRTVRLTRG